MPILQLLLAGTTGVPGDYVEYHPERIVEVGLGHGRQPTPVENQRAVQSDQTSPAVLIADLDPGEQ
jgi:hypothetical protein